MRSFVSGAGLVVLSQLVSSVTNTLVVLYASKSLTGENFGHVAFILTLYSSALALLYSLATEPWLRDFHTKHAHLAITCVKAAAWLGTFISIAGCVVVWLIDIESPNALYVLFLAMPFLLSHEAARISSVAEGRQHLTLALDLGWFLGSMLLLCAYVYSEQKMTSAICIAIWSIGSTVGLLFVIKNKYFSGFKTANSLVFLGKDIKNKIILSTDSILMAGSAQLVIVILLAGPGFAFVGLVRLVEMCFAPAGMSVSLVRLIGQPIFAKYAKVRNGFLFRDVMYFTSLTTIIIIFNILGWLVVPDYLKITLLGERWSEFSIVLVAGSWYIFARLYGGAAQIAVRVLGDGAAVVKLRILNVLIMLAVSFIGVTFTGDTQQLLVILGTGYFIGSMLWVIYLGKLAFTQESSDGVH